MKYEIVSATSTDQLVKKIEQYIGKGWKPLGSPMVAETHRQNRYRGTQHIDTLIELEYSQALTREDDPFV